MTERPAISVLLPCRNSAATIRTQLEALSRQRWAGGWELIVSDNGSSDETAAIVDSYRERFGVLRVVDSSDGRGIPHATNVAAAHADGEALAVCNDDDEMADGWLEAMGRALADHDLVGGRLDHTKLNEPWVLAVRGTPQVESLPRWSFGTHLPFSFSCAVAVRRELHREIGGFDEAMVPAGEDVDYWWRAQYAGAKIGFVPEAVMHYRGRSAYSSLYRQARNYGIADVLLYKKHRPLGLPAVPHRVRAGLRGWAGVGRAGVRAWDRPRRALFVWRLGRRAGLLEASARERVLLL